MNTLAVLARRAAAAIALATLIGSGRGAIASFVQELTKASDGSVLWQSGEPDKGHFQELSRFADAIAAGGDAPNSVGEIFETSALALDVEDLISGRASEPAE
jgi:hypothetical protein